MSAHAELAATTAAPAPGGSAATDAAAAPSAASSAPASADSGAFAGPWHILLFYRYTPITGGAAGLESVESWQRALCERLGLKGRIRLAAEGINATLGGTREATEAYVAAMDSEGPPSGPQAALKMFAGIEYKRSTSDLEPFPTLGLFRVQELTASGKMGKSKPPGLQQQAPAAAVAANGEADAAAAAAAAPAPAAPAASVSSSSASFAADVPTSSLHLTPAQWHEALSSFDPETMLLLDVRNAYETAIGTFEGAVDPKLRAFHQLPEFINQNLPAIRAKKKLLMFCTGGIRCEKASLYMAHRAPDTQVLQLEGGIHKYMDLYPDGGHFRGKNFVFDGRLAMGATEPADKTPVGKCLHCAQACDALSDEVACHVCRSFVILCDGCRETYRNKQWRFYCAEHMLLAAAEGAPEVEDPKHKNRSGSKRPVQAVAAAAATPAAADVGAATAAPSSSSSEPSVAHAVSAPAAVAAAVAAASDDHVVDDAADPSAAADADGADSVSLGCTEQWQSFLSRFRLGELEAQLAEIDAILAFFALPAQKKLASKSRNRKANLFKQKRRLQAYIQTRKAAEAEAAALANGDASATSSAAAVPSAAAPPARPQLLSFVPFLNV